MAHMQWPYITFAWPHICPAPKCFRDVTHLAMQTMLQRAFTLVKSRPFRWCPSA